MAVSPAPAPRIDPFWQRLRGISSYPFRGEALGVLAVLSVAHLLTLLPLVLGLLCWVLLTVAAYKYAFTVLRDTANGHLDPRSGILDAADGVVWKFLLLNIALIVVIVVLGVLLGPLVMLLLLIGYAFIQPAATMSLAMDESLGAALNPATWVAIIGRVGWPYLLLFVLLVVFQISAWRAEAMLANYLPGIAAMVLARAAFLWGLFGTFHLMGYLLFQYHEALGFEPSRLSHEADLPRNRDSALVDTASGLVQDGDTDAALALLREEISTRAVSLEAHELYRRLLRQAGNTDALVQHARTYLHLLLMEKQERRAMGLLRESLDTDPGFSPLQAEDGVMLADKALAQGQAQLAMDILAGVLATHPRGPAAAQAALRRARLLVDRYGRDEEARAVLEATRALCRDATLQAELDQALAAIPGAPSR